MAWYDEAVFYHIYPLGLAGAPKQNDYGEPVHRLNTLLPLAVQHCTSDHSLSQSDTATRLQITRSSTPVSEQMRT